MDEKPPEQDDRMVVSDIDEHEIVVLSDDEQQYNEEYEDEDQLMDQPDDHEGDPDVMFLEASEEEMDVSDDEIVGEAMDQEAGEQNDQKFEDSDAELLDANAVLESADEMEGEEEVEYEVELDPFAASESKEILEQSSPAKDFIVEQDLAVEEEDVEYDEGASQQSLHYSAAKGEQEGADEADMAEQSADEQDELLEEETTDKLIGSDQPVLAPVVFEPQSPPKVVNAPQPAFKDATQELEAKAPHQTVEIVELDEAEAAVDIRSPSPAVYEPEDDAEEIAGSDQEYEEINEDLVEVVEPAEIAGYIAEEAETADNEVMAETQKETTEADNNPVAVAESLATEPEQATAAAMDVSPVKVKATSPIKFTEIRPLSPVVSSFPKFPTFDQPTKPLVESTLKEQALRSPFKPIDFEAPKAPIKPMIIEAPKSPIKPMVIEAPKSPIKSIIFEAPKSSIEPIIFEAPKSLIKPIVFEAPKSPVKPIVFEAPKPHVKPIAFEAPKYTVKPVEAPKQVTHTPAKDMEPEKV
jgi:hypothetical protein